MAKKEHISLSVHAPYYVNLTSKSEQTREKSKDWILKSARVAAALGASVVTIHAAREVLPDVVLAPGRRIEFLLGTLGLGVHPDWLGQDAQKANQQTDHHCQREAAHGFTVSLLLWTEHARDYYIQSTPHSHLWLIDAPI